MKSVKKNRKANDEPLDVTGLIGKWILEVDGKIVASSDRVDVVLRLAEKYPVEDTLVTKVLYPGASFY